jgi:hypothetical protein
MGLSCRLRIVPLSLVAVTIGIESFKLSFAYFTHDLKVSALKGPDFEINLRFIDYLFG